MPLDHDTLVYAAKTYGLIYLVGFFLVVVAFIYWPSRRKRYDDAARSVLNKDDKPWR